MTISQAREAAQEIFGKHQRHEVTFDLSASDVIILKKGAEAIKGARAPKGSRPSEWAATIASTVRAVEAVDDKAERHTCRMWDVNSLQRAVFYGGIKNSLHRPSGIGDEENSLYRRLDELPPTSPYYEAAQAAEEKINKLEREETRLLKLKEALQREVAEINDQLEGKE
jgi:hypothetical protein